MTVPLVIQNHWSYAKELITLVTEVFILINLFAAINSVYSWVSRDVINFTGGELQIDTLSSD